MTYTWTITKLECKREENGLQNVVFNCFYTRTVSHVYNNQTYTALISSNVFFINPEPETFIQYQNLTKVIIENWLEDHLDVPSIDANLQSTIENEINPSIVVLPLPF